MLQLKSKIIWFINRISHFIFLRSLRLLVVLTIFYTVFLLNALELILLFDNSLFEFQKHLQQLSH